MIDPGRLIRACEFQGDLLQLLLKERAAKSRRGQRWTTPARTVDQKVGAGFAELLYNDVLLELIQRHLFPGNADFLDWIAAETADT